MKNQHTPGPWKVQKHNTIENKNRTYTAFVSDDINLQFVKVTGFNRDEAETTAALIAAAPELLEALQVADYVLTLLSDEIDPIMKKYHNEGIIPTIRQARAAVAKAIGENTK